MKAVDANQKGGIGLESTRRFFITAYNERGKG
jgi:hypothetical protein